MLGADFDTVVSCAARGDGQAFARLWRDAHPPVVRYLAALVADPDDVASEVWLEIARGLQAFVGDESGFRAWLFTLARRRALDAHRRNRRTPVTSTGDPADLERAAPDDTAGSAVEQAGTDWALRLIGQLPRDQAEVLLLRVVAGLPVADVAVLLGKTPGAVRVSAHRGLRTLAARLRLSPAALEHAFA